MENGAETIRVYPTQIKLKIVKHCTEPRNDLILSDSLIKFTFNLHRKKEYIFGEQVVTTVPYPPLVSTFCTDFQDMVINDRLKSCVETTLCYADIFSIRASEILTLKITDYSFEVVYHSVLNDSPRTEIIADCEVVSRQVCSEEEIVRVIQSRSMEDEQKVEMGASRDFVDNLTKRIYGERAWSTVEVCMVCMDEFSSGKEVIEMPCSHLFHSLCILRWLENWHTCPLCRFEMPIDDSVSSE